MWVETYPDLRPVFEGNLDPTLIIRELSLRLHVLIEPGKTLLFIDEIQECPRAIIALRYFYEEMPELHVIGAGSLVDFAIQQVGVPVGRVEFLYLYPLNFLEFLEAMERQDLALAITTHKMGTPFSEMIHKLLLDYFAQYLLVGGMPDAVKYWRDENDFRTCQILHHTLIYPMGELLMRYETFKL
ncbi:MAG: AAA family ATPase [Waddliaceae bacterium]